MKTRLAIFITTLLLLPYMGLLLSDGQLNGSALPLNTSLTPLIATLLVILLLALMSNHWGASRSGNNLLRLQRNYYLAMAFTSGVIGWLLVYLNLYTHSWLTTESTSVASALIQSLLFATLAPAILSTRALLGSFASLLKLLSRNFTVPSPAHDTAAFVLIPLAFIGLLGGVAWPVTLFWLFWLAPLLLLLALQLLWHESSIFAGLADGDWSRIVTAAMSGLIVCNFALVTFEITGGTLLIDLPNMAFQQLGYALFGLICLQLGDVIAEAWRGKTRAQVFKKKSFPIPVVFKK
jgi:hypothetical protein